MGGECGCEEVLERVRGGGERGCEEVLEWMPCGMPVRHAKPTHPKPTHYKPLNPPADAVLPIHCSTADPSMRLSTCASVAVTSWEACRAHTWRAFMRLPANDG